MLLVVKFRNQLHRLNPALQVDMRNTRINGVARGCYGYITDPATGLVIEVDTEESCCVRERGKPGMIYRGVCNMFRNGLHVIWAVVRGEIRLVDFRQVRRKLRSLHAESIAIHAHAWDLQR